MTPPVGMLHPVLRYSDIPQCKLVRARRYGIALVVVGTDGLPVLLVVNDAATVEHLDNEIRVRRVHNDIYRVVVDGVDLGNGTEGAGAAPAPGAVVEPAVQAERDILGGHLAEAALELHALA